MRYKYILWDWNGTLLDDLDASLCAVNDMLKMYDKPIIDLETYYSYIDTPIYKFYERLFDFNVVSMEVIKPLFSELYINHNDKINLADGAVRAIDLLREKGARQYILSAAHINDIMRYAREFGVAECFEKIEAANDYEAGSKTERAVRLLAEEKIDPAECVVIGDTLHDYDTARVLGVDCILYSRGHTDIETLKNTGNVVCTSFDEIIEMIS
ncbi:MAG: HAD family hydrolase [Ruminococcaceae bacterium]|nr:HAD family hydrolase [Oscillospiraceae bacterium]